MDVRKELEKVRSENVALRKVAEDLVAKASTTRAKRSAKGNVEKSVPMHYVGIALAVEKRIALWTSSEVRELVPFQAIVERNWQGRGVVSESASTRGVDIGGGRTVVPIPPAILATRGSNYCPSVEKDVDMLDVIVTAELRSSNWGEVFTSDEARRDVTNTLKNNSSLLYRLKQSLSDTASTRKRVARDFFFTNLGYTRLCSRYSPSATDPDSGKGGQVTALRAVLDGKPKEEEIVNLSLWRTTSEQALTVPNEGGGGDPAHSTAVASAPGDVGDVEQMGLFRGMISVRTYHEFLGYSPTGEGTGSDVITSIMSLARLDAWMNTLVMQLGLSNLRGGGGQVQKAYTNMFGRLLNTATSQLIGSIRSFVMEWEPEELLIPSETGTLDERKQSFLDLDRQATVVFQGWETLDWSIAVHPAWFKQYISSDMGLVCDCIIATVSSDFRTITLLGEVPPSSS